MRIVLLTARKKIGHRFIGEILGQLGDVDATQVTVVGLHRPVRRVAVGRYLVVGPSVRPRRAAVEVPVAPETSAGAPLPSRAPHRRAARVAGRIASRLVGAAVPSSVSDDPGRQFASGVVGSRAVREAFARADLVIALDRHTTFGAWRLAQRIPGPEVVFKTSGALMKLSELDAAAQHSHASPASSGEVSLRSLG